MASDVIFQQPETPIEEEWIWRSDVIKSDSGKEQLISVRECPMRQFSMSFICASDSDVLQLRNTIFANFGNIIRLPLWQYQAVIKTSVLAGATTLPINSSRSDLRTGQFALIIDRNNSEIVSIDTVNANDVILAAGLQNGYDCYAKIIPIRNVYSDGSVNFTRPAPNQNGSFSATLKEFDFIDPFLNQFDVAALTQHDGFAVLDRNAIGDQFDEVYNSGKEVNEYVGIPFIRSRWNMSQITFNRKYKCDRVLDLNEWFFWKTFADYCKGSSEPFLLPTYRPDFEIAAPFNPGANQLTLKGHSFTDDYWPQPALRRLAIFSQGGVHYTNVSAAVTSGDNDILTLSSALPGGAEYGQDQIVSLLLQSRIANDRIGLEHVGLSTIVSMSIATVDF